jgi:hypothetical protein
MHEELRQASLSYDDGCDLRPGRASDGHVKRVLLDSGAADRYVWGRHLRQCYWR